MTSKRSKLPQSEINPKTTEYEFLGPPGAFFVSVACPLIVFALIFLCNENGCPPRDISTWKLQFPNSLGDYVDWKAIKWYASFQTALALLWLILPGKWYKGRPLRDGTVLEYKCNAFMSLVCIAAYTWSSIRIHGIEGLTFLYDHFLGLTFAAFVWSVVLATGTYVSSFRGENTPLLAEGGNTGNWIYDWFIGRVLNPRIPLPLHQHPTQSFDIKTFIEIRVGLIHWLLFDVAFLAKQYERYGFVTDSMWLVVGFQSFYVIDALWFEEAFFSTMDVATDGSGFMLDMGNLLWVATFYCLQARFLVSYPVILGPLGVAGVLGLKGLGYYIFRSANLQKDKFKADDPSVKDLEFIKTEKGSKLLVDGWWGKARHINYLGDWLMAWSWCLPVGFSSPIPYFYVVYFAVLLIHRERRDDHKCHLKYGKDWEEYRRRVPSRIIPGIY